MYDFPLNHTTTLIRDGENRTFSHIQHVLQETNYFVNLRWPKKMPLQLSKYDPPNSAAITAHRYILKSVSNTSSLIFTAHFSPDSRVPSSPVKVQDKSARRWAEYWMDGGFVDLTASKNPNATELQRQIITSQYPVRVNSAAQGEPPQESGLMNNVWYGRSRLQTALAQLSLIIDRQVSHGDGHLVSRSMVNMGQAAILPSHLS